MDDAKRVQREAEETAKEHMRKMDGTTDLDDKVANLGDDINKNLGNAGDAAKGAVDDADDKLKEAGDDIRRGAENVADKAHDDLTDAGRDVEREVDKTF